MCVLVHVTSKSPNLVELLPKYLQFLRCVRGSTVPTNEGVFHDNLNPLHTAKLRVSALPIYLNTLKQVMTTDTYQFLDVLKEPFQSGEFSS